MNTTYITTTIPYVNATPHIGFALELVQADVLARYARLLGERVRFQTGTDENAFKNVLSARAAGVSVTEFVTRNAGAFHDLVGALDCSPDDFVRTTEARHRRAVHDLWRRLRPDDVYEAPYRGLYCDGCEDFLLERDLADGCCPAHGVPPTVFEERNHFFRLSAYQDRLEELIADDTIRVVPEERKREVLDFIRRGLTDISISRDAVRSGGWGIAVPGDPTRIIYVWIDALVNYLAGLANGRDLATSPFWQLGTRKVHVVGKNVWKFHAVYWPALLLSAGLPVPDDIVVHGFVTVNGRKISKSDTTIRTGKDPATYIADFGADAVRYYLLRAIPPFRDGDFSAAALRTVHTADLANGLGNLCTRLTTLGNRVGVTLAPEPPPEPPDALASALANYRLDAVLDALWSEVQRLNREIADGRPWEFLGGPRQPAIVPTVAAWLESLRGLLHWLQPIVPTAASTAAACLAADPVRKCPPLFPRR